MFLTPWVQVLCMIIQVSSCFCVWTHAWCEFTGPSEQNADLRACNHDLHQWFLNPFITLSSNRIRAYVKNWLMVKNDYVGPLHHLRHRATLPNIPKDVADIYPIPFFLNYIKLYYLIMGVKLNLMCTMVTYHGKICPTWKSLAYHDKLQTSSSFITNFQFYVMTLYLLINWHTVHSW